MNRWPRPTPGDGLVLVMVGIGIAALTAQVWRAPAAAEWVELRCGDAAPQRIVLDHTEHLALRCRIGISGIDIEPGRVRFSEAPCSNRVCLQAGWLSRSGDTAACLPNGVSLRLGGRAAAVDAVAG